MKPISLEFHAINRSAKNHVKETSLVENQSNTEVQRSEQIPASIIVRQQCRQAPQFLLTPSKLRRLATSRGFKGTTSGL